ncbi:MAG: hypothetical protein HQ581_10755 [Planctomycetes bacterium]|nr:hypothetical protein [Planctomycetota bacterium]
MAPTPYRTTMTGWGRYPAVTGHRSVVWNARLCRADFCDFAGYSNCAIGVVMCLGFGIPANFRFPYTAIGLSGF